MKEQEKDDSTSETDVVAISKEVVDKDSGELSMKLNLDKKVEEKLKDLEEFEEDYSISPEYIKMKEGEKLRGFFLGIEKINGKYDEGLPKDANGKVDVGLVLTTEKKLVLLGGSVITNSLLKLINGTPVSVLCKGEKTSGQGGRKYLDYEIKVLKPKKT